MLLAGKPLWVGESTDNRVSSARYTIMEGPLYLRIVFLFVVVCAAAALFFTILSALKKARKTE